MSGRGWSLAAGLCFTACTTTMPRPSLNVQSRPAITAIATPAAPSLTASWVDNTGGMAITRLERREAGVDFAAVADAPPGVTAFVDTAVLLGVVYCYRALAYTDEAVSPYTDEVCATPAPPPPILIYPVTVTVSGPGSVTVIFDVTPGLTCSAQCTFVFPAGTALRFLAVPNNRNKRLTGWGGACAGTGSCLLTVEGPLTVTARFR